MAFVGEQPGAQEDRCGEPFVGPSGRLLRETLADAGLDADDAYLTNVVKHFTFTTATRGQRRIHKPPSLREMTACRPWLTADLRLVRPQIVVALGASAAKALLGSSFRVTKDRGTPLPLPEDRGGAPPHDTAGNGAALVVATLHPLAVLRSREREAASAGVVSGLRVVAGALE
ncbi:uracil-DNA glycosylase [Streptomyces sp. NBC_01525]|uniref:uracil-DNA glycosylase family protein n=1 Tax=Streptomyces sp. NBC_01525 TaxID=2903893 RepID=UPI0038644777